MDSFDFDQIIERSTSDSDKWRFYGKNVLPLWVADMDFKTPQAIIDGLKTIIDHGIFGYGESRPQAVLTSIKNYMLKRYQWEIKDSDIILLPNLLSGLNIAARAIGEIGDGVLTTTPIYPPFLSAPINQHKTLQHCPLKQTTKGRFIHFEMDFQKIEKASNAKTKLFMLCHPHNPSGRIFSPTELSQLADLAQKNNWVVLSDEIHAELLLEGHHQPYALISEATRQHSITLFSSNKTYNIAGLGASFAIIENPIIRSKFEKAMTGIVTRPNIFAMKAMQIAFSDPSCDKWLQALKIYLKANRDYLISELASHPGIKISIPEATFLMWLDFNATKIANNPYQILLNNGLALNDGESFGENGKGCVRINFACPRERLAKAIHIIKSTLST